jgi:periplasmic protein TonB
LRSGPRRERNWLLGGLIIVSVGIHVLLLIRLADVYRSEAVTSIELTLQDVSRPVGRDIPRPPRRLKMPPLIEEAEPPKVTERSVSSLKPPRLDPVASILSTRPVEELHAPAMPDVSAPAIAGWSPEPEAKPAAEPVSGPIAGPPEPVVTRESYFELVRQSIERNKKYPEAARADRIEGRVAVRFVITPDGNIRNVAVVKRSHSRYLDEAALNAVKGAAPFPKPPKSLFKGPLNLVITIIFELR